jgi:hypothetical protein
VSRKHLSKPVSSSGPIFKRRTEVGVGRGEYLNSSYSTSGKTMGGLEFTTFRKSNKEGFCSVPEILPCSIYFNREAVGTPLDFSIPFCRPSKSMVIGGLQRVMQLHKLINRELE